ncbi:hypothetical protein RCG17_06640 [Neobacillus sp. PS3-12]|uniref:hypothetical protein n=1 Tax=Neobacillus sp. PS3-12 TaxID=3070677 RepID=UPI0027E08E9A|nr:hypothetical protein [Neobacillus sp. PS3-12]WML54319.1 hypothetical protein RCG17_06640 [Neobacillus sp. PS3-12]
MDRFKGILSGMLLGDGSLSYGGGANAFLRIQHSEKQLDYLLYKSKLIEPMFKFHIAEIKPSGPKNPNTNYSLKTHRDKFLTKIIKIVYPKGKKKVTTEWLNWLTVEGLALWYMDDGCLVKSYSYNKSGIWRIYRRVCEFSTQGFTLEENQLLIKFLKEKFDLDCKVKKTTMKKYGTYYKIKVMTPSANKMFEMIKPYIIPGMEYKINMENNLSPNKYNGYQYKKK